MKWHNEMRTKFPGKQIMEHPDAPKTLTRICLGLCGGLHDRIGQLPLDLFLANQTQRILLIKWQKPQPIEEFLVPPSFFYIDDDSTNGNSTTSSSTQKQPVHDPNYKGLYIDWTFPPFVKGWGTMNDNCHTLNECARQVRAQPKIDGNVQNHKEFDNNTQYAQLIEDDLHMMKYGKHQNTKHLTFTIQGHMGEEVLEEKLRSLGETDMIHSTKTFGKIFHLFFKPHPKIQRQINTVQKELGLVKNEYTVAHCRVRHPKAYKKGERLHDGTWVANADKVGLTFEDRTRKLAIEIASRSIQCAATAKDENSIRDNFDVKRHPIYFMSDESELVNYFAHNLTDSKYVTSHPEWFEKKGLNRTTFNIVKKFNIVARDQSIANAHIDKNKGRKSGAYYGVFVDLFLGIGARCVSFGIGNYASFAAKISGTKCRIRYAKEKWGKHAADDHIPMCRLLKK